MIRQRFGAGRLARIGAWALAAVTSVAAILNNQVDGGDTQDVAVGAKLRWPQHAPEYEDQQHRDPRNDNARRNDQIHVRFFEQKHIVNALPADDFGFD